MEDPPKIHVDGITHRARKPGVACGMIVHDRALTTILKMYVDAVPKEVDCMACIADDVARIGHSTKT